MMDKKIVQYLPSLTYVSPSVRISIGSLLCALNNLRYNLKHVDMNSPDRIDDSNSLKVNRDLREGWVYCCTRLLKVQAF